MKTKEDKNIKKKPASGVRARNKKGRYVGDDKSTPDINEAYADGKTPKRKTRKKSVKQKHPVQKVRQPLTNAEFLQVTIIIGLIIFFIYCSN